jgi:hypothetical protein
LVSRAPLCQAPSWVLVLGTHWAGEQGHRFESSHDNRKCAPKGFKGHRWLVLQVRFGVMQVMGVQGRKCGRRDRGQAGLPLQVRVPLCQKQPEGLRNQKSSLTPSWISNFTKSRSFLVPHSPLQDGPVLFCFLLSHPDCHRVELPRWPRLVLWLVTPWRQKKLFSLGFLICDIGKSLSASWLWRTTENLAVGTALGDIHKVSLSSFLPPPPTKHTGSRRSHAR